MQNLNHEYVKHVYSSENKGSMMAQSNEKFGIFTYFPSHDLIKATKSVGNIFPDPERCLLVSPNLRCSTSG